jgi:uncharacterized protein
VSGDFNFAILHDVAHRPWTMPDAPWVMTQTWNDLLFAHWRLEPQQLRAVVPSVFALDLFDGSAWLAIVPFEMTNVGPRGVPSLPWVSRFAELNVRTYVRVDDRPGVYFFSLDAASALAVRAARLLLNLPYYMATMRVVRHGSAVRYESTRQGDDAAQFRASYAPAGGVVEPRPGTLEYFLTERYCLYQIDRRGRAYRLEIHHPRWPLQPAHAEIARNTMTDSTGLTLPDDRPLLHFSRRQDVVAWPPSALR